MATVARRAFRLACRPSKIVVPTRLASTLSHRYQRDERSTVAASGSSLFQQSRRSSYSHSGDGETAENDSKIAETSSRRVPPIMIAVGFVMGVEIFWLLWQSEKSALADGKEDESEETKDETEEADDKPKRRRRPKVSLHDKTVIGYENRIRAFSTPDKIFRYFATLKGKDARGDDVILMTPQDFVRSLLPGHIQPEGLGLDKFRVFDRERYESYIRRHRHEEKSNVFQRVMSHGLLTFSDYLFLVTLLSTPARNFEIAFRMFDLNGDGELQLAEFDRVRSVIASGSPIGMRHRDHFVTGNVSGQVGSGLTAYFFGKDSSKKLTYRDFQAFVDEVKRHVLRIEFEEYLPHEGRISELDFADCLLTYTGFNDQRKRKYRKRVRGKYQRWDKGISFDEFEAFTVFLEHLDDLALALSTFTAAGAPITAEDLRQAAHVVAGVQLSDHLVDVIVTLFDEDGDGCLSEREFIRTMRTRQDRGLSSPMDLGLSRLLNASWTCAKEQAHLLRRGDSRPPETAEKS